MTDYKWVRPDVDLYHLGTNLVSISNSENLSTSFYSYAVNFHDAASCTIEYLLGEACQKQDIAKLDLWYFAIIYLYRQSLELLLKANIFQVVTSNADRKNILGTIRHDLKQAYEMLIDLKALAVQDNENATWLMEFLSDISSIDRESDMFRYPFGNNLEPLFKKQTHISLVATQSNMSRAFDSLKSIYFINQFPEKTYSNYPAKLIVEGGSYYQQSVVGYKYPGKSFYPYYSSYEECGTFLKSIIISRKAPSLFVPMCYLFRNAVELGLKRLIIEDSHLTSERALKIVRKKKHSIAGLWNSIEVEIQTHANAQPEDTTLDDAKKYIEQFHNFDPHSDLFRYPCSKDIDIYFSEETVLDIENIASCFEELCHFLDAVDSMLSELKAHELEMLSYYADY